MIKAVIFDMDGLLIDSEPLWEEAEIKAFSAVGVPLTSEMTKQTMGLRSDEVVHHWHSRYPWEHPSQDAVNQSLVQDVATLVRAKGQGQPGVAQVVKLISDAGLPMAIASSSQTPIIEAVLERLGIRDQMQIIQSAENEPYGKPHPGVYITTAKKLGVHPQECLAFEDSPNGVLSAKAAKMKCVAVPDAKMLGDRRFAIADAEISSLEEFTPAMFNELQES